MYKEAIRGVLAAMLLAALALSGCGEVADQQEPAQPAGPQADAAVQPVTPADTPRPFKGSVAPDIVAKDVATGQTIRLSELRGQVVMINFWASWCGPCRVEMPDMQTLHTEMGERLRIVAVGGDSKESRETLAAFAEALGLTFSVAHDYGKAAHTYRIMGLPTTFIADQKGILQARVTGAMSLDQMRSLVLAAEEAGKQ